jgi:N-ethylmaleimide reductase
MTSLYDPIDLDDLHLQNRVFMAPLTRNRARPDGTPGPWTETYYRQRSTAGLIISEATQISAMGKGYINTPGIYLPEHIAGWRQIVDGVHEEGGRIFLQLWHVGRISHTSLLPNNVAPVAPSAVRANAQTVTEQGFVDVSEPTALSLSELHSTIDKYGGSITNRIRFLIEVTRTVMEVWDPGRIGVRLSPRGTFNDMGDENATATFTAAVDELATLGLGYLHMVDEAPGDAPPPPEFRALFVELRQKWPGIYIANGGYDGLSGEQAVNEGRADAIAYGRAFIANPDLPKRLQEGARLNAPDQATFYGGTEHGYIDYPALG